VKAVRVQCSARAVVRGGSVAVRVVRRRWVYAAARRRKISVCGAREAKRHVRSYAAAVMAWQRQLARGRRAVKRPNSTKRPRTLSHYNRYEGPPFNQDMNRQRRACATGMNMPE